METFKLELSHDEAQSLSDALPSLSAFTPVGYCPWPFLLLKIGSAFLDTAPLNAPPAAVAVVEPELWILRDIVKSSWRVGQANIGHGLLVKIYTGLRAVTAGTAGEPIGEDEPEPTAKEVRQKMEAFNARASSPDQSNPGDGAGDKPGAPV